MHRFILILRLSLKDGVKSAADPAKYMQIYRSREVGQSYVTSVWTTLVALAHALYLMISIRPQVVFQMNLSLFFAFFIVSLFFSFKFEAGNEMFLQMQ